MEYKEYIGYHANTANVPQEKEGTVTVYAERRNNMSALGEYGGDAYPFVYETKNGATGLIYGMAVAADGVGQGAYTHASLEEFLRKECADKFPNLTKEYPTETKLSVFLSQLYGEDFLNDEESLQYALRSFSDVPCDGYFAADKSRWGEKGCQVVRPFFLRDSQSLGSRIVCVGLFHKFRKWLSQKALAKWDKSSAEQLRNQVETYLGEELKQNVLKMFSHSDAPDTVKRNYYFLCSTVAAWFYVANPAQKTVSALALNCGDARLYVSDLTDGVRQISVDDAFDDGAMSAFVHFGASPRLENAYHDGKFHARIVRLQYPCALFACSDGVYDTCPAASASDHSKISLPYGDKAESNDFLFELNFLEALRKCYCLEDFRRQVAFNFYAQANAECAESTDAGNYPLIKKDDSGTLAGSFFGERNGLELFEKLRQTNNTFIDRMYQALNAHAQKGDFIPYYKPHVTSSSDKQEKLVADYATDCFKSAVLDSLKVAYPDAFQKMTESGETALWGVENCTVMFSGFKLNVFLCKQANLVAMLQKAVEVYLQNGALEFDSKPKKWESVLSVDDAAKALREAEFEKFVQNLKNGGDSGEDDKQLQRYESFCKCFYGDLPQNYHDVVGENECLRSDIPSEE